MLYLQGFIIYAQVISEIFSVGGYNLDSRSGCINDYGSFRISL